MIVGEEIIGAQPFPQKYYTHDPVKYYTHDPVKLFAFSFIG